MKQILLREVPDELHAALVASAERDRRSMEKQALHLLESTFKNRPADTFGELLEKMESSPVPDLDETLLENFSAGRGRRSNRT